MQWKTMEVDDDTALETHVKRVCVCSEWVLTGAQHVCTTKRYLINLILEN